MGKKVILMMAAVLLLSAAHGATAAQVGWWALDDGVGTVAKDRSGNGNDGTLTGGPTWAAGKFGMAVQFDGVDDYISIPHNASLCVTNEVTVSAWVYAERTDGPNASGYQGIVAKGNAPRSYSLYTTAAGPLHFSVGPSGAYIGPVSSAPLPTKQWVHVAVKVEGGVIKFFINGQPAGTGGSGVVLPGTTDTSPVVIGRTAEGTGRSFQGMIDEVHIWNQALTDQQINDLATKEPPGYRSAANPTPANGAVGVTMPLFQWVAGYGALFHDVYVGTKPDLTAADRVSARLPMAMYFHIPGLQAGTTYYWRVDEIDAAGTVTTGDVWSFKVTPATAWTPVPSNGAAYLKTSTTLTWTAGQNAITHDAYVSTNKDEVEKGAASAFKGNQKTASLQLDGMTPDTTYYWRVDEINMSGGKATGEVWQFTTRPAAAKTELVGWWKLENEGTAAAVDYSGYDRDGVLMGNPQWVDGYLGSALKFNGTTDYVETNYTENLAKWTICCWVTSPAAPAATSPTGPVHREKNYQMDWGHTNAVYQGASAMCIGGTWYAAKFGSLAGNTWYHLAATFDGTAMKAYCNGALITSTPAAGVPDAETGTLKIGRHSTAAQFFTGTVDDVRVYNRALSLDEIKKAMQGDPLLASNPQPAQNANLDILSAPDLSWTAGEKAAKHDVYFGKDLAAVKTATASSAEYKGRQSSTSLSLAGLAEFGGGTYFWRIDEVEADGTTIHKGNVWTFTVAAYLIVDEFESYTDQAGAEIFTAWVDGFTDGLSGSIVGYAVANQGTFGERTVVHGGRQSMPMDFDNSKKPYYSEATTTFAPLKDWTGYGVTNLSLWVRGYPAAAGVAVNEAGGKFTVTGSGTDIWNNSDQFTFVYKILTGDGTMVARVIDKGTGTNTWAKGGVMIRDSLNGGSTQAMMILSANSDGAAANGYSFQRRLTTNGASTSDAGTAPTINTPYWVKIERVGDNFSGYVSADGKTWRQLGASQTIPMTAPVYIGLCVTSHAAGEQRTMQFDSVSTTGNVSGAWQGVAISAPQHNSAQPMYVIVEDSAGKSATATNATAANAANWTEWKIPLSSLTGVNLAKVKKMYIGVGDKKNPAADGTGRVFIDDIRVVK